MEKEGLLCLSGSPGRPGNSRPLPCRGERISCGRAAKNTKLPPPPHLLIRPNHATESWCFCLRLAPAPTLLPVHQPYNVLKYHGCSNYCKYSKKLIFNGMGQPFVLKTGRY